MIPSLSGNLSSVMNLVPTPGKMTILPLLKTDPVPIPIGPPYVVMFNPEQYEEGQGYNYDNRQPPGSEGSQLRYINSPPSDFTFDFLIDGTGASGDKREVTVEVLAFKALLQLSSVLHRPSYLLLVWGTFVETCVCSNFRVKYTLFRSNGTPLRATVQASFEKHTPRVLELLKLNLLSPDLTHFRVVKEGDTLPNLSNTIYESPRHYIELAKANDLTSPRRIKRGRELQFPPIEK